MEQKRRKTVREINFHCKTSSLLVVNSDGMLLMLHIPFTVLVIEDCSDLVVGDKCRVSAVKMDEQLLLIYIIENKPYYYYYFTILIGEDKS